MDVSRCNLVLDTSIFIHFSDKYFWTEGVFIRAALHLLFLLFLAVAASSNSADQPLTQQEVCMASSSSSCPDNVEPNKEEATVSFRHCARTINVDFVLPASNRAVAAGDEDLQLRQEAMAKAITVLSHHSPETTEAETLKPAMGVVNLEAQRWKPIFRAINRVLESGADDRTKEEAFAAAKVQLNSELGQEGPNAVKIDFEYM